MTCVSLNCPFIIYCIHYSLKEDRGSNCSIKDGILEAARKEEANGRNKVR